MVRQFKLPDVGEGVAEGELVSWLVEEGDTVTEDQPVAEVETDKALVEVPAPVDGTVRELRYEEGDVIPVGDVFVTFDVAGEERDQPTDEEQERASEPAGEGTADAETATDAGGDETAGSPGATGTDTAEPAAPQDRVFAPPRARKLARKEGIDLSSVAGSGPGGRITAADVRAAIDGGGSGESQAGQSAAEGESAEATTDSSAGTATGTEEAASTATEADAGGAETGATTSSTATGTTPSKPPEGLEAADRDRTLAAPATRRIADEEEVDIDAVPTDEERDGEAFVTPEAVREYAKAQKRAQEADREAVEAGEPVGDAAKGTEFAPGERERREPYTGVRKRIAEAMVESKYTAPHVSHHDDADVTDLVDARAELKPRAEERGIRLTYMPFIIKAVVAALNEHPEMNAVLDEENDEIVYRDYYNIGIATATDVGLMVPVLENADEKGLLQLASEMNELVQKARERTISPDELQGSTFTITNIGGIGGEYATPIINYPEAGILAIGEISRKPRVVADDDGTESIEPRSVMTLSASFDHRLIDGAVGAQFTNTVIEYLENPHLLLLE